LRLFDKFYLRQERISLVKRFLLSLAFIAIYTNLVAQHEGYEASTYQSKQNQYYWKNRVPYEGYWQQDVHYTIKATVNEKLNIIDGSETLVYTNNSPDELAFVYFHLYQNAFQPESYFDNLSKSNGVKTQWTGYEAQKLGTSLSKVQQDGIDLKTELDNTILKVYLTKPLKSGESTSFEIDFITHYGNGATRRRMKYLYAFGKKLFNGTHFYPRISVYDKKFGWDTQQHLGREFYGDFGQFDVELNFASNYIVEATGLLINKSEVLPDSLLKKLDIKNFAKKPWNSKPSVIIPYSDSLRKTWKYHAINVHDFAFTASPHYRIGETRWNGISVIAVVQEPHAAFWQNAASYAAKLIEANSREFGLYAYPKMVVADAGDGMEYPMLTLDGGYDPDYRQLFAHEISHNWFFGMVGNNETYRAALDEGFTQFLTAWSLEQVDGKYLVESRSKSTYVKKHKDPAAARYIRVYKNYIHDAIENDTKQLNTHSDDFEGALGQGGGYKEVYYKTATMLYNLQYVLGDSLFLKAMQHYFDQWKIAHPYFEDFRNSFIEYTKVDLNWFFDEWIETTKTIDYSVKKIKRGATKGEYKITFERKDLAQMPIDFRVTTKNKKQYDFHIPNTWFVKETTATVLPKWAGWGNKLNTTYTAAISVPEKIKNVQIDPSYRLADHNLLNNSKKVPVRFKFDHQIKNEPVWESYELFWRPDIWYNGFDGIKAGVNFNGNYLRQKHIFDASIWLNTGTGQQNFSLFQNNFNPFSFRVEYKTALRSFAKKLNFIAGARQLDGLKSYKIGLEKFSSSEKTRFYIYFKTLQRADSSDLNYLLSPTEWQVGKQNNALHIGIDHSYYYSIGNGKINLDTRTAAFTKDYAYSIAALRVINKTRLGRLDLSTRIFGQYTIGNSLPDESSLYYAGANPEEMMENKFVRSVGLVPNDWQGYSSSTNHFHYGGGLNLRGYAGYTPIEFTTNNNQRKLYKGNSGAAINAELSFARVFRTGYSKIKNYFGLDIYLFGDAGSIDYSGDFGSRIFSDVRADAGLGTALTIKKWGVLDKPSPLTLRLDLPFFLSRPPNEAPEYIKFRWIVGVSRAF
jgi:Peptidase family M1 domain